MKIPKIRVPNIEQKTHIFNLSRSKVRYWCFRFRKEIVDGTDSNGAPAGLREHFEKLPGFTGWKEFAVSWDLPHLANCDQSGNPAIGTYCSCARHAVPLTIVGRLFSVWDEWRAKIKKDVPVLKIKGKHRKNQAKALSKDL